MFVCTLYRELGRICFTHGLPMSNSPRVYLLLQKGRGDFEGNGRRGVSLLTAQLIKPPLPTPIHDCLQTVNMCQIQRYTARS